MLLLRFYWNKLFVKVLKVPDPINKSFSVILLVCPSLPTKANSIFQSNIDTHDCNSFNLNGSVNHKTFCHLRSFAEWTDKAQPPTHLKGATLAKKKKAPTNSHAKLGQTILCLSVWHTSNTSQVMSGLCHFRSSSEWI